MAPGSYDNVMYDNIVTLDSFCAQSKKSGGVVVQEDCVRKLAEVQVRTREENFKNVDFFFYFTICSQVITL